LISDGFLNVLGTIKAIQSEKLAAWLKNLTAKLEFFPNGGLPIVKILVVSRCGT
jgi:hypothetical protein